MSTINNGGPAFPTENAHQSSSSTWHHEGMTMRDWFATHASETDVLAQAEILRLFVQEANGVAVLPDDWRVTARYMHADAMLRAREAA